MTLPERTREWVAQQARARAHAQVYRSLVPKMPGTLTREEAARLTEADGPAPRPTVMLDDEIARAADRLFDTHPSSSPEITSAAA